MTLKEGPSGELFREPFETYDDPRRWKAVNHIRWCVFYVMAGLGLRTLTSTDSTIASAISSVLLAQGAYHFLESLYLDWMTESVHTDDN